MGGRRDHAVHEPPEDGRLGGRVEELAVALDGELARDPGERPLGRLGVGLERGREHPQQRRHEDQGNEDEGHVGEDELEAPGASALGLYVARYRALGHLNPPSVGRKRSSRCL